MNNSDFDIQVIPLVAHEAAQERMSRVVRALVAFATVEALALAGLAAVMVL